MKKVSMLKSIAILSLMIIAGSEVFAQVTVTNPQIAARPAYNAAYFSTPANFITTGSETATVGADAPYFVTRDANVNGPLFNPSTFEWSWTGITGLKDLATSTSIVAGAPVAYNLVVATMPAAPGLATIKTQEQSNPIVGTGCLDATGQTLSITVVSKPTYVIPATNLGGCGISGVTYDVSSTLTGTAPFYIDYTITGVDLTNAPIGAGDSYSITLTAADAGKIKIDPTQLAHLGGAAVTTVAGTINGKYTVTINKVWDAVSYKAMNSATLATTTPASGASSFDIFVYPTPQTKPIQFIKVLP